MKNGGGVFITLDGQQKLKRERTLGMYLRKGVYGSLMSPDYEGSRVHYATLADYSCVRDGTHVFFFMKREIFYAGQAIGNSGFGSFYINGPYNPIKPDAPLVWDERTRYAPNDQPGIFSVNGRKRCQPYLIKFRDSLGLQKKKIRSDEFYFELSRYPYPLPSSVNTGMSFWTVTPGETGRLLELLQGTDGKFEIPDTENGVQLNGEPVAFCSEYGLQDVRGATSEDHLEASVSANPDLLPRQLRPVVTDAICRQVPMCPFKPEGLDRADICYYDTLTPIREGTVPNRILELKNKGAGKSEIEQVNRYLRWLYKASGDEAQKIQFMVFAPSYTRNVSRYVAEQYRQQLHLYRFDGSRVEVG